MSRPAFSSVVAAIFLLAGCRPKERQSADAAPAAPHADIYARVDARFDAAIYGKPNEASADPLIVQLAPLLVQAVDSPSPASSGAHRLAGVVERPGGGWGLDPTRPTIYTAESTALLHGREFQQRSYLWWHAPNDEHELAGPWKAAGYDGPPGPCRGYRMTLDADGFPIVWEVLGAVPPPARIFVAARLETAAARAFGPPLPHRRFSIETELEKNPNVVVARLLDDAPMPMGPIYYLTADLDVPTLICRCMPSQFSAVAEEIRYALAPLGSLGAPAARFEAATFPLPAMRDPEWLQSALRLPPGF